jgi:cullin-associated NEDD8-dissociated protein 1
MSNPSFNPQPLSVLTPLLDHPRPAVRKRSIITLGAFVCYPRINANRSTAQFLPPAPPEAFTDLLNTILIPNLNASSIEVQKTNVSLIAAVARCTPQKIAPALGNLLPRILESVNSSDPELSDAALQTLETFVYRCPTEISPYLGLVIAAGIQAIKYDPVR